jgi:hypothetical protein
VKIVGRWRIQVSGAERVGVELGVLCRTANLAASEPRGAMSQG